MIYLDSVKRRRVLLLAELTVCLGPTFLYLLTGVVLVPHQLVLLVGFGVMQSVWPLLYYAGTVALFVAVNAMYRHLTNRSRTFVAPRTTFVCLVFGVAALCLGPVGTFALGGIAAMDSILVVPFLVFPIAGVLHLAFLSRSFLARILRDS